MTREEKVVYIIAQSICAAAELQAMRAANTAATAAGQPPPWDPDSFRRIPETYGIHHNAILTYFQE